MKHLILETWQGFEKSNGPRWALFGLDLKLPKTLRKRVYNHNRVFLCKKGLKRQLKLKKWQGHVVKSDKN